MGQNVDCRQRCHAFFEPVPMEECDVNLIMGVYYERRSVPAYWSPAHSFKSGNFVLPAGKAGFRQCRKVSSGVLEQPYGLVGVPETLKEKEALVFTAQPLDFVPEMMYDVKLAMSFAPGKVKRNRL